MGCYIYFYLKKKDTPVKDFKICLAHLCTSDARELSDDLDSFGNSRTYDVCYSKEKDPMYGHCNKLSDDLLKNTIDYYNSKVSEMKESKARYKKELQEANENYLKAANKVVLEDIKETIHACEEMIAWCDEETERFAELGSYITHAVRDVLDENAHYDYSKETNEHIKKNDYELVYYMG